jgi:hypothetical protein
MDIVKLKNFVPSVEYRMLMSKLVVIRETLQFYKSKGDFRVTRDCGGDDEQVFIILTEDVKEDMAKQYLKRLRGVVNELEKYGVKVTI